MSAGTDAGAGTASGGSSRLTPRSAAPATVVHPSRASPPIIEPLKARPIAPIDLSSRQEAHRAPRRQNGAEGAAGGQSHNLCKCCIHEQPGRRARERVWVLLRNNGPLLKSEP